jgi:hypothetical protein
MMSHIPFARHGVPSLVHVTIANSVGQPTMTSAIVDKCASEFFLKEESLHLKVIRKIR